MTQKKPFIPGTIILFGILLIGIIVGVLAMKNSTRSIPEDLIGVLRPQPKLITDFELTDHHGQPFNAKRLQGRWSFVFFGYTHCPDICPTTLSVLTAMQAKLLEEPEVWSDSQVFFVSVDPERDTLDKLANYMAFFNKEFTAVTGTKESIDNLAQQFSAGYIIEPETRPGYYLVSHTAAIFLADPQARIVGSFSQPHDPATIASLFREIRSFY